MVGRWTDRIVMLLVRGYQRYLSPCKGYRCAHRVLYEEPSCSEYFRQSVGDYGSLRATVLLKAISPVQFPKTYRLLDGL
jgi:putative component of membrane protein insertase Oxa1/YidC/SpoIIIJ protein YidD